MTKLISKENPWLDDESCESLDTQPIDSHEKEPNSFFLKAKDDGIFFSRRRQERLQKHTVSLSSLARKNVRTIAEWTFPKSMSGYVIESSKAYQAHFRIISKPQKRFTLAAVEKFEIEDFQQEEQEKAYIEKQAQLFEACREKLVEEYEDSYVLFEDGSVLDSGETRAELAMRAYQKYGMKPLFIEKVVSEPESLAAVWTPFPLTE